MTRKQIRIVERDEKGRIKANSYSERKAVPFQKKYEFTSPQHSMNPYADYDHYDEGEMPMSDRHSYQEGSRKMADVMPADLLEMLRNGAVIHGGIYLVFPKDDRRTTFGGSQDEPRKFGLRRWNRKTHTFSEILSKQFPEWYNSRREAEEQLYQYLRV